MLTPTDEQAAILAAVKDPNRPNLYIQAFAGCGKTSTLEMIAHSMDPELTIALAFNVKIKEELEKRFPSWVQVKTFNSIGHGAWAKELRKYPKVEGGKLGFLVTAWAQDQGLSLPTQVWGDYIRLISSAMNLGIVPSRFNRKGLTPDSDEVWTELAEQFDSDMDWRGARDILNQSILQSFGAAPYKEPVVSYDDQIYMPTLFADFAFQQFKTVMVDEAQDLSPLNHEMVRQLSRPKGRLIVCGDRHQAIYAFRGADHSSMDKLRALRSEWCDLTLSLTFRCAKAIVSKAQAHAPRFRAAEGNPIGAVTYWDIWGVDDLQREIGEADGSLAVLCRNNAPLFSAALKFIKAGVPCLMIGRDIGKGLQSLARKICHSAKLPSSTCISLVLDWKEKEMKKAGNKKHKQEAIEDKALCLIAVLEEVKTAAEMQDRLHAMFNAKSAKVTLASGHRAKGLEWNTVIHLDPERVPSRYAETQAELIQEENLRYVIETRPKLKLILASLRDFQRENGS